MLSVTYGKLVPYPFEVVLGQYYDHEHIARVHPDTLGEYRLVSVADDLVVYDQIWPGGRRRSRVEQRLRAPGEVWFDFVDGRYKGTRVRSLLEDRGEATFVEETYFLPWLPNWRWLARLALPSIARRVDQIWDEDLAVEVCRGGWPGLPDGLESFEVAHDESSVEGETTPWIDVTDAGSIRPGAGIRVVAERRELALFERDGELFALDHRCPHTGGPLALGPCVDGAVICPWHGAAFSLSTGEVVAGPSERGVARHRVRRHGDRIQVALEAVEPDRPIA